MPAPRPSIGNLNKITTPAATANHGAKGPSCAAAPSTTCSRSKPGDGPGDVVTRAITQATVRKTSSAVRRTFDSATGPAQLLSRIQSPCGRAAMTSTATIVMGRRERTPSEISCLERRGRPSGRGAHLGRQNPPTGPNTTAWLDALDNPAIKVLPPAPVAGTGRCEGSSRVQPLQLWLLDDFDLDRKSLQQPHEGQQLEGCV